MKIHFTYASFELFQEISFDEFYTTFSCFLTKYNNPNRKTLREMQELYQLVEKLKQMLIPINPNEPSLEYILNSFLYSKSIDEDFTINKTFNKISISYPSDWEYMITPIIICLISN